MERLRLVRVAETADATFGVLIAPDLNSPNPIAGEPFAVTLEPPWKDNAPNVSCIPAGLYAIKGINSPKYGYTFEVADVPGRTHILFHKGNAAAHTKGCVLVGEQFERLPDNIPGILASRPGYREFMFRLRGIVQIPIEITYAVEQLNHDRNKSYFT